MNDVASCCAEFYEKDWVATLMGDSFHPGGLELSRRLAASLGLREGDRVLDVASGTGATATMLARDFGCDVVGIDVSEKNVARAGQAAAETNLPLRYELGNATALPFDDGSFDAVICECAVSTFVDKPAAATEFHRVLRPGGRLGLSDMCSYTTLPDSLAKVVGPWACLQDALTVEGYQRTMLDAGLRVTGYEDESDALLTMALEFKRKLIVVGLGKMAGALAELDLDIQSARALLDEARDLVKAGQIQYCRLTFSRGRATLRPDPVEASATAGCDPSTGCC